MSKEEIKKILDRLERIDHKEYSCSFEFADSGSFEETCMCFDERKKLANYIKELQQENKQLKEELKDWDRIFDTFSKRKYAHRYLEERRKEIPNLLCPDSDEIYQKYYELKDNWNKLKEWCKGFETKEFNYNFLVVTIKDLLDKMQELENGNSNE